MEDTEIRSNKSMHSEKPNYRDLVFVVIDVAHQVIELYDQLKGHFIDQ